MKRGRPRHESILTPREWEVIDFLREGLTNEQIASRLGISEGGAKFHVSEIISKLGVATREEAATWRQEQDRPWGIFPLFPIWSRLFGAGKITASPAVAASALTVPLALLALTATAFVLTRSSSAPASLAVANPENFLADLGASSQPPSQEMVQQLFSDRTLVYGQLTDVQGNRMIVADGSEETEFVVDHATELVRASGYGSLQDNDLSRLRIGDILYVSALRHTDPPLAVRITANSFVADYGLIYEKGPGYLEIEVMVQMTPDPEERTRLVIDPDVVIERLESTVGAPRPQRSYLQFAEIRVGQRIGAKGLVADDGVLVATHLVTD